MHKLAYKFGLFVMTSLIVLSTVASASIGSTNLFENAKASENIPINMKIHMDMQTMNPMVQIIINNQSIITVRTDNMRINGTLIPMIIIIIVINIINIQQKKIIMSVEQVHSKDSL